MGKPKQNKRFCRRNADNQFLVFSGMQNMENAFLHSTVCSPVQDRLWGSRCRGLFRDSFRTLPGFVWGGANPNQMPLFEGPYSEPCEGVPHSAPH